MTVPSPTTAPAPPVAAAPPADAAALGAALEVVHEQYQRARYAWFGGTDAEERSAFVRAALTHAGRRYFGLSIARSLPESELLVLVADIVKVAAGYHGDVHHAHALLAELPRDAVLARFGVGRSGRTGRPDRTVSASRRDRAARSP